MSRKYFLIILALIALFCSQSFFEDYTEKHLSLRLNGNNYTQLLGGGWNLGLCYTGDRIFIAGETGGSYQGIVIRGERF
jgi:hypothetical protein